MAQVKVTSPDGQTYTVNAPAGATDEEILRYVQTQTQSAPKAQETPSMPAIGPLSNAPKTSDSRTTVPEIATRGMTAGLSDYAVAAARQVADRIAEKITGKPIDTTFDQQLQGVRGGVKQFQSDNPITGYGAELAGGVASPLYRAVGAAAATPFLRGSALADVGLGTRLATYTAQGGATGALGGAGYAQSSGGGVPSLGDLTFSTAMGTATGAPLGALTGLAIEGGGRLFNWLGERLASRRSPPGATGGPSTPPPQFVGTVPPQPGASGQVPPPQASMGGTPAPQPGVSGAAPNPQAAMGGQNLPPAEMNARDVAARIAARAANSDRLTNAAAISQRLDEIGQDAVIGDLGPNLTAYMGDAAQRPGPGMQTVTTNLTERAAGREQRLVDRFRQAVSENYNGLLNRLRGQRTQNAGPMYEQAFADFPDIGGPELEAIASRPDARRALSAGIKVIQDEAAADVANGVPGARIPTFQDFGVTNFNEAGDPIVGRTLPLRAWDAIKRGFDHLIYVDDSFRDQFGRLNQQGRAIESMNNALKGVLDRRTTNIDTGQSLYRQARSEWAGPSAQIRAAGDGRSWLTDDIDDIRRAVAGYGDSEMEAARAGVVRNVEEMLQENPVTTLSKLTTGGRVRTNVANRLRMFFPDQEADDLMRNIQSEVRMRTNENSALHGSQTKLRQAVGQEIDGEISNAGDAAMALASGHGPMGIASNLANRALRAFNRPTDQVMEELATMLSSRDPGVRLDAAQRIEQARQALAQQEQALRALAARNSSAVVNVTNPGLRQ